MPYVATFYNFSTGVWSAHKNMDAPRVKKFATEHDDTERRHILHFLQRVQRDTRLAIRGRNEVQARIFELARLRGTMARLPVCKFCGAWRPLAKGTEHIRKRGDCHCGPLGCSFCSVCPCAYERIQSLLYDSRAKVLLAFMNDGSIHNFPIFEMPVDAIFDCMIFYD